MVDDITHHFIPPRAPALAVNLGPGGGSEHHRA